MERWTLQKRWIFTVSLVLHGLLLMVVYVMQSMVFPYLKFNGLVPLLLPIVSTGIAIYQGCITGGVVGIFAGIFCDISFNEPVGVFTVFLTMTGLLVGYLADTVIARGGATYFIFCAIVLAAAAFVQVFPFLVLEDVPSAPLVYLAIRQTVYSLAYALPIWFFVRMPGGRTQF